MPFVGMWKAPRSMKNQTSSVLASGGGLSPYFQHSCMSFSLHRGHWLGVKSACQLRQESFLGTDPSQQAGEENPRPHPHPTLAASRTETLSFFSSLSVSVFSDKTTPHPATVGWPGPSWL